MHHSWCSEISANGVRWWIFGEGPMQSELQVLAREADGGAIRLCAPTGDVPAVLRNADVYVSSAAWEGQSNALLEAMASGCLLVLSDLLVSAARSLVTVHLLAPGDSGQLATCVSKMLNEGRGFAPSADGREQGIVRGTVFRAEARDGRSERDGRWRGAIVSEVMVDAVVAALDRLSDGLAALQLRLPPQSAESLRGGIRAEPPEPLGMRTSRHMKVGCSSQMVTMKSSNKDPSRQVARTPTATQSVSRAPQNASTVPRTNRLRPVAQLAEFGARQLVIGRLDRSSRLSVAHAAARMLVRGEGRSQAAAGPAGGLVAHWRGEELVFDDDGGILDLNPNTERDVWLPQAMGMYYADAFAAYLFARRFARTADEVWRARSVSSFNHATRTYFDYPTSSIWYHHDFKNAAIMETESLLAGAEIADLPHADLVSDAYEPANVFAVRAHWLALRRTASDRRRLRQCIRVLSASVRPDGLLLDDWRGLSSDVRDLGYTGFAAGFLARLLNVEAHGLRCFRYSDAFVAIAR